MKRILLLLEDYNELLYIETLLKKLGFDAMSAQKTKGIYDTLMSFRPAVIVISETLKDQKAVEILADLKDNKPDLMGMILLNPGSKQPASGAEAFIPRPIHPQIMLKALADWVGMNEERLVEKIDKLGLFKSEQERDGFHLFKGWKDNSSGIAYRPVTQEKQPTDAGLKFFKQSSQQSEDRASRFKKALQALPSPKSEKMEKKTVTQEVKEFRARSNDTELVNIDKERKAFVDALYNKKKKAG